MVGDACQRAECKSQLTVLMALIIYTDETFNFFSILLEEECAEQ